MKEYQIQSKKQIKYDLYIENYPQNYSFWIDSRIKTLSSLALETEKRLSFYNKITTFSDMDVFAKKDLPIIKHMANPISSTDTVSSKKIVFDYENCVATNCSIGLQKFFNVSNSVQLGMFVNIEFLATFLTEISKVQLNSNLECVSSKKINVSNDVGLNSSAKIKSQKQIDMCANIDFLNSSVYMDKSISLNMDNNVGFNSECNFSIAKSEKIGTYDTSLIGTLDKKSLGDLDIAN